MTRKYANNFSTTLNGAITDVATSITVTDASGLPTVGGGDTCLLTIDDGTNVEIIEVTSVSSNTLTVVRGREGTSGTAFADTDPIELRATASSFIDPAGEIDFTSATIQMPYSASPTMSSNGHFAIDSTVADFSAGVAKYYAGEEMGIVAMPISEFSTPTDGHVVSYNATNDEFELVAQTGGGLTQEQVEDIVGAMVTGNTETLITVTYDDADGTLDFVVAEASIDHDALTNYLANEHIDWTSTTSNFSTSGTAATGALTVTGNIAVTGTVDGRDVATDGTKLDGIEAGANVTDETNVTDALDGATLTDIGTPASGDLILLQDASDSNNLKVAQFSTFGGGGGSGDLWSDAVDADIVPDADGTRDLGSAANRFAELHVDDISVNGTVNIENNVIYFSGGSSSSYYLGHSGGTPFIQGPDANHRFQTNNDGFTITFGSGQSFQFADSGSITASGASVAIDFGGVASFEIPNGASPTVNAAGEMAIDTAITDYTGMIKYHDGTEELTVIAMPTANLSTTDGDVVSYNATTNELEFTTPSGGGGTRPAFSATSAGGQTVGTSAVKIQFNTEVFDTNSNYDPTTNYRFTPTVAGKYQINASVMLRNVNTGSEFYLMIYKNGSVYRTAMQEFAAVGHASVPIADIIDFNGSTDYVEIYARNSGGNESTDNVETGSNFFSGCKID